MRRRDLLKITGAFSLLSAVPMVALAKERNEKASFRFCLNTSTISGRKLSVEKYIHIAAEAGYDGVELWVRDVQDYLNKGN